MEEKKNERIVQDVFDEMTEEHKNVVYEMIEMALEEKEEKEMADNDKFANMLNSIFVIVLFVCLSISSVAFTFKLLTFMF